MMLRSRVLHGVLLTLGLVLACTSRGPADEPTPPRPKPLVAPPAVTKDLPESIADLRAIEMQVQAVVARVSPAVVGIRIGAAQGSGVIVTRDGLVLTAGHVSGQPGRKAEVILPNGRKVKAETLGRNTGIDSGMLKITEPGEWPHVEMGKSANLKKGQWVIAIGHPGGFRSNRTPVVRLGRVLVANKNFIRTDATLVGGDSGGPLFDMAGNVVGIHSRIGGVITENVHVPVDTYRESWDRLAKGESWGGPLGVQAVVATPGGKVIFETEGRVAKDDPLDTKQAECHRKVHTIKLAPGSVYTIDLVGTKNPRRYDPYLRLEDAKGRQIAEDDDGGGNLNSRIVYKPVKEGEYKIIVTSCEPGQAGPYKLVVRQAELKAVAGKADVLQVLGMPKPVAPLLLDKLRQVGVNLFATGTLLDAKGNPVPGKELKFEWAKGGKAVKTDTHGVARFQLSKKNVKDLVLAVPDGYKATLELTDSGGNYFAIPLSKDFNKERVKSAGGKLVFQESGALTEAAEFDKVRKECRSKVYPFKMVPGYAYTIDLKSPDFDSYLRLEDSTGKQLAEDDDGGGQLNSRIVFRTTKEDTYRIVVTTCDPGQAGTYRVTVHQAESKEDPARVGESPSRIGEAPPREKR
jgi:serine protease Do